MIFGSIHLITGNVSVTGFADPVVTPHIWALERMLIKLTLFVSVVKITYYYNKGSTLLYIFESLFQNKVLIRSLRKSSLVITIKKRCIENLFLSEMSNKHP